MNLQNMAPNVQRALLLTLVFGALAAGIYLFAIESTETALVKARRALQEWSFFWTWDEPRSLVTDVPRMFPQPPRLIQAVGNTVLFPALCTGGLLHVLTQERASSPAGTSR